MKNSGKILVNERKEGRVFITNKETSKAKSLMAKPESNRGAEDLDFNSDGFLLNLLNTTES